MHLRRKDVGGSTLVPSTAFLSSFLFLFLPLLLPLPQKLKMVDTIYRFIYYLLIISVV